MNGAQVSKINIRRPPIDAVFTLHPQNSRGICRWCGLSVQETTPALGLLRLWHSACEAEFAIINRPDAARTAVWRRDNGICADCGEDWNDSFQLIPDFYVSAWGLQHADPENTTLGPDGKRLIHLCRCEGFPYVSLKAVSLWHVDHHVPLWKVAHLPPLERIEFFKLWNLVTRCVPCHKRKSKAEEAEQAHLDRMAKPEKPARKSHSRPMPGSRASGWRKPMNKKAEKRNGKPQ